MPRDGSNIYSKPPGTSAVSGDTISSSKFNSTIDDITSDLNLPRPIVAGGTGSTTPSAARAALGVDTAISDAIAVHAAHAAFHNRIINGDFSIDRDGGSTKTPGVGVYTFDIWKGHADGLEQVVEALPAGDYTLVFDGGGTGHVDGQTAAASPALFTTASDGDISVVVPSTVTEVMLLPGDQTSATDLTFRARPRQIEETLLNRYYLPNAHLAASGYAGATGQNVRCLMMVNFPVPMRAAPSFSYVLGGNNNVYNDPTNGTFLIDQFGARMSPVSSGAGPTHWNGTGTFDARL